MILIPCEVKSMNYDQAIFWIQHATLLKLSFFKYQPVLITVLERTFSRNHRVHNPKVRLHRIFHFLLFSYCETDGRQQVL